MTELQKQVRRAQRRINLQRFLVAAIWSLGMALLVAALGIATRKVWHMEFDGWSWTCAWLGGSIIAGLLVAGVWTWLGRRDQLDAAIELDRRFNLRERVSSSLSLTPEERETEIGRALVADASRRVSRIDVRDGFGVHASRWAWLPVATLLLAVGLVFVPDAGPKPTSQAAASPIQVKKQIKKSADELKKKLARQRQDADEKGLKEASDLIQKLEQGMDELTKKKEVDRKQAMVKMNDLAQELKARRDNLLGADDLRKQLNQLKQMQIKRGPAERLAKALKEGDFQAALDQVARLGKELQQGTLTPQQQQQLAEQLQQMQDKLRQMANAHQDAQQELERQIAQKKQEGDVAAADQLQKQLDRLQQQNQQMQRLRQMADKMAQCAQSLSEGQQRDAQTQLAQLAQDLQEMQAETDELQMLDDALDQLVDARDAMNCQNCEGAGCTMCQGLGFDNFGQIPGMGLSEGQGRGDRPEEETNTGFYDSKVSAQPRKGKMVVIGTVRGPNAAGDARIAIRQAMDADHVEETNPLTNLRLPRGQREQVQQYFDAVRTGEN